MDISLVTLECCIEAIPEWSELFEWPSLEHGIPEVKHYLITKFSQN